MWWIYFPSGLDKKIRIASEIFLRNIISTCYTIITSSVTIQQKDHGERFATSCRVTKKRKWKEHMLLFLASDYKYLHLIFETHSIRNCRRLVRKRLRYCSYGIWSCSAAASKQGSPSLTPLLYDYVCKLFINPPTRWLKRKAYAIKTFSLTS